jgi:hypothetical protein
MKQSYKVDTGFADNRKRGFGPSEGERLLLRIPEEAGKSDRRIKDVPFAFEHGLAEACRANLIHLILRANLKPSSHPNDRNAPIERRRKKSYQI